MTNIIQFSKTPRNDLERIKFIADLLDLFEKIRNKEDVFVQYKDSDSRGRGGTIARIKKIDISSNNMSHLEYMANNSAYRTRYASMLHYIKYNITMELRVKGRSSTYKADFSQVDYLKDYTGETVWKYDPTAIAPKPVVERRATKDRLGREIVEGNLVIFSSYGATMIGHVTRISERGVCYCKNMKLTENDYQYPEKRITENSSLILLNEELLDQLVLARLMY